MNAVVVRESFGQYKKGALITDPATVASLLKGPNRVHLLPINHRGAPKAKGAVSPAKAFPAAPGAKVPSK